MKKSLITGLSLVASLALNAQTIHLDAGWTNAGLVSETSIMDFNDSRIQYIWQFKNGQWRFFSPNEDIMNAVMTDSQNTGFNIEAISLSLGGGDALWISSTESFDIRVGDATFFGAVKGVVKDAIANSVITQFTYIIDGDEIQYTSADGEFLIPQLPAGEHSLILRASGYRDFNISVNIDDSNIIDLGQLYMMPESVAADIEVTGTIRDAVSGQNIENVRMILREGYNNTEGTPVVDTIVNGTYDISISSGQYTVELIGNGYYSGIYNISFVSENPTMTQDFSLAPLMDEDMRAILEWGETPRDLDSHLIALNESTQEVKWHVYYGRRSSADQNATLDRDDTSGFGPETITLYEVDPQLTYKYFVYNFSSYPDLKDSEAHLKVIYNGEIRDFYVPNEDGRVWKVFEIRNGVLIPCVDQCMYSDYNDASLTSLRLDSSGDIDAQIAESIIDSYTKD